MRWFFFSSLDSTNNLKQLLRKKSDLMWVFPLCFDYFTVFVQNCMYLVTRSLTFRNEIQMMMEKKIRYEEKCFRIEMYTQTAAKTMPMMVTTDCQWAHGAKETKYSNTMVTIVHLPPLLHSLTQANPFLR